VQWQKGTWRYGSMHVGCGFDAHSIGGEGFATRVNLPGQTLVRLWLVHRRGEFHRSIRDRYVECISRGTAAPGRSSPVGSSAQSVCIIYNRMSGPIDDPVTDA
jgi:hypothetical protein